MAWRRTETPLFRGAMSVVAFWCLAWAVLGYRQHAGVASYDQRPGYREAMARCAGDRLRPRRNGEWLSMPATRWEMTLCTERTRLDYRTAEARDHRRITIATLLWALLPSLAILLLAAFASDWRRPRG